MQSEMFQCGSILLTKTHSARAAHQVWQNRTEQISIQRREDLARFFVCQKGPGKKDENVPKINIGDIFVFFWGQIKYYPEINGYSIRHC